ncbi:MAG: hypothetical protein V4489_04870 [Chlamydiota bacterium]
MNGLNSNSLYNNDLVKLYSQNYDISSNFTEKALKINDLEIKMPTFFKAADARLHCYTAVSCLEEGERLKAQATDKMLGAWDMINHFAIVPKFNRSEQGFLPSNTCDHKEHVGRGLEKNIPVSCSTILKNPDAGKDLEKYPKLAPVCVVEGEVSLGDWLRMKFSKTTWENDGDSRDIIPRAILAILHEGDPDKVQIVNEFLQEIDPFFTKARDMFDLKSFFHGNNDFTITIFTRILYQFGLDETKIYPETLDHLLNQLLTLEGVGFDDTIPYTSSIPLAKQVVSFFGYETSEKGVKNTENHILMINGSAYLKNRFMERFMSVTEKRVREETKIFGVIVLKAEIAKYKNTGSELEIKLSEYLDELYEKGLVEFNSIPYAGYTVDALLNLYDFADGEIKVKAAKVLDMICYQYALHSTSDGMSFRPMGRQLKKVINKEFIADDSVRPFMQAWLGGSLDYYRQKGTYRNGVFALTALTTSYRPLTYIADILSVKHSGYLSMTGHRFNNAEVSYKGRCSVEYLISGGGIHETKPWMGVETSEHYAHEIVSRNPALLVTQIGNDGNLETKLDRSIFLGTDKALRGSPENWGPGIDSKGRNNSGTYHDFSCAACPVHIPDFIKETGIKIEDSPWALYKVRPDLTVAVYSTDNLGMFAILPLQEPSEGLLREVATQNPSPVGSFTFPSSCNSLMRGNTVYFDVNAPLDRWVITGVLGGKEKLSFSEDQRLFKNWSAHGVMQEKPFGEPLCLLREKVLE